VSPNIHSTTNSGGFYERKKNFTGCSIRRVDVVHLGSNLALRDTYHNTLHKFADQDAVGQTIIANAPHSGTYLFPNYPNYPVGASETEKKALDEEMYRKMEAGPFVLAHIRTGAMRSFGTHLATELITNILAALFVTVLLTNAMQLSFRGRVLFAVGVAAVMLLDHSASTWNWYSSGTDFFFAEAFDAIVGWVLAGMVIAKVLGRGEKVEAPSS
jgi:hypothetical protein